jgi:dipeptidyl-peptidase III
LSATQETSDGSSVSEKHSLEFFSRELNPETDRNKDPEPDYSGPASSSSSSRPPPFTSLYFPPTPDRSQILLTEPNPCAPPAFTQAERADQEHPILSAVEAEVKAALPRDTKGESSSKNADEAEPPPPYTEGSSPLEGFTYTMAAAGGAASIITQVQQGGPAPVNTLDGKEEIFGYVKTDNFS